MRHTNNHGATKNRAFWLAHPICDEVTSAKGMPAIICVFAPKIAGREAESPKVTTKMRRRIDAFSCERGIFYEKGQGRGGTRLENV